MPGSGSYGRSISNWSRWPNQPGSLKRAQPPGDPRFPKSAMAWEEVTTRATGYWAYMETPETEPQAPPDEKPPPEVPDQPGTSPGEPGEPAEPS
jgi:hypothetical protein